MASDLCKPLLGKKGKGGGGSGDGGPLPGGGPVTNHVKDQSLRSKHLHIVSKELFSDRHHAFASDEIRAALLNHFGSSLIPFRRSDFTQRTFRVAPSVDDVYFDVAPPLEALANAIFKDEQGKEFTYINFTLNVPFNEREVEANAIQSGRPHQTDAGFTGKDPRISTYKFEARYNFYLKEYEDKIANAGVEIRALPNAPMYSFLLESLYDKDTKNFDKEYLDYLAYSKNTAPFVGVVAVKKFNFNNYLERYVVPATNLKSDSVSIEQRSKFNNLMVVQDDVVEYNRLAERYRYRANYGFYLEIPFETPITGSKSEKDIFKKILKQTNTDLNLYNVLLKTTDLYSYAADPCGQLWREFVAMAPAEKKKEWAKSWDDFMGGRWKTLCGTEDSKNLFRRTYGTLEAQDCNTLLTEFLAMSLEDRKKEWAKSWDDFMGGRWKSLCGSKGEASKNIWRQAYKSALVMEPFAPMEGEFYTNLSYIQSTTNTPSLNFSTTPQKYRSWDLTSFFSDYEKTFNALKGSYKDIFNLAKDKNSIILGETNDAIQKYQNNSTYDWYQALMNKTANVQFKKGIQNNRIKNPAALFDTLSDTPYEVLFYRIEKSTYDWYQAGATQNFYLPNPMEESEFKNKLVKFFDSQVKYGEEYSYNVYAYPLVLGKKYHYEAVLDTKRFATAKSGNYYIVFDFLCYYLFNYRRVLRARNKGLSFETRIEEMEPVGLQLVDEFIKFRYMGAKNEAYKKFLNTMKSELKKFIRNFVGIARVQAASHTEPRNCKEVLQQFSALSSADKKKAYVGVPWSKFMDGNWSKWCKTDSNKPQFRLIKGDPASGVWPPSQRLTVFIQTVFSFLSDFFRLDGTGRWDYSADTFEKEFGTKIKAELRIDMAASSGAAPASIKQAAIDKEFNDLLASWSTMSKIIAGMMTNGWWAGTLGGSPGMPSHHAQAMKNFKLLAKYTNNIYYKEYNAKIGGSVAKGTDFDAFKIVTKDYIPLMEIPLFSVSDRIMDSPPVSPQVTFAPFKDVDNKVMIKLKSRNTQYYEFPHAIRGEDEERIRQLKQSRGTDKMGRLLFKTDDYLSRFEIYRMEEKPRTYTDFATHLRKKADLQGKYSSFEYYDTIVPNKKYYYVFRALDAHNNFSNPSPVYEFVLHDDGGYIFPEVRTVDFEDKDYFDFSTTMQKYVQIKPSAQNVILNPELIKDKESAFDLDCYKKQSAPPPLGIAPHGVWGKNFKLRLTSKTSGKKVDLNFTFNKAHKKVTQEEKKDENLRPKAIYNKNK